MKGRLKENTKIWESWVMVMLATLCLAFMIGDLFIKNSNRITALQTRQEVLKRITCGKCHKNKIGWAGSRHEGGGGE